MSLRWKWLFLLFMAVSASSVFAQEEPAKKHFILGGGFGWSPYGIDGSIDNLDRNSDRVLLLNLFGAYQFHPDLRLNSGLDFFSYSAGSRTTSEFSASVARIPLTISLIAESLLILEVGAGFSFGIPLKHKLYDSTGVDRSNSDINNASFKRTRSVVDTIITFAMGKEVRPKQTIKLAFDWAPYALTGTRVLMSLNQNATSPIDSSYVEYSVLNIALRYEMQL